MKSFNNGVPNMCGHLKDEVLMENDVVCRKKGGRKVKELHSKGMKR